MISVANLAGSLLGEFRECGQVIWYYANMQQHFGNDIIMLLVKSQSFEVNPRVLC